MRVKNTNFLEQNFEKILLAIAAVVVAVVVWVYLLGSPNTVEVAGQQLAPAEVDPLIREQSDQLAARLNSADVPEELAQLSAPPYVENFAKRMGRPVLLADRFTVPAGEPFRSTLTGPSGPIAFHEPVVPAPVISAVRADMGSIDPGEVQGNVNLAKLVPAQAPYDVSWVSIVAQFDMARMIGELIKPDDDQRRQVPADWWRNSFGIVDVQIERQELLAGNQWSEPVLLPVMAGAIFDPRKIPDKLDLEVAGGLARFIKENQSAILQPPFYILRHGRVWAPPTPDAPEVAAAPGAGAELAVIDKRIVDRQREIETSRKRLATVEKLQFRAPKAAAGAGGEDLGDGGDEEGARPAAAPKAGATPEAIFERTKAARIAAEQKRIATAEKALADLVAERNRLAPPKPAPGAPNAPAAAAPGAEAAPAPEASIAVKDILQQTSVELWSSDLRVTPGKTYRYRMRLAVVNPFFGKKDAMIKEQAAKLADQFLLYSQWTDWTPGVHVEPHAHFFATAANKAPAPGQATVEVYKYFDGDWRKKEIRVKPGDRIGDVDKVNIDGQAVPIDYSTGAVLVDIDFNYLVASAAGRPEQKQRLIIMAGDRVESRRVDLDKDNPRKQQLQTQAPAAKAAANH